MIHTYQDAIAYLFVYGHLEQPFGVPQDVPHVLAGMPKERRQEPETVAAAVHASGLTLRDDCVVQAMRSFQSLDNQFDLVAPAVHGGRPMDVNGEMGPATSLVMGLQRCGHPDYERPDDVAEAVGRGNWPRCHDVGDFHAVSIKIANSPPSFLAPLFDRVKERVKQAYAELGLLIHWDGRSPVNIDFSFVSRSSGWIGLAIVGNGQSCNSRIWCRYLSSYRGGSSDEQIVTQWTTLVKHELGHNCGLSHSRGGVMNPSIVNGLPISWKNDPSEGLLKTRFGGVPVPMGPDAENRKLALGWEYSDGRFERISYVPVAGGGGGWPT